MHLFEGLFFFQSALMCIQVITCFGLDLLRQYEVRYLPLVPVYIDRIQVLHLFVELHKNPVGCR
jgi:hypothetical protein